MPKKIQIINGCKSCSKCKVIKPLSEFDIDHSKASNYASHCKMCKRKSIKPISRSGYKFCKICGLEKLKSDFHSKGDSRQPDQVFSTCKTCLNKTTRRKAPLVKSGNKWCAKCSTEKSLTEFYTDLSRKSGYASHCKKCHVASLSQREKVRKQVDPDFKIKKLLQNRVRSALNGTSKSASTMNLIGCSVEQLKKHLQETAISNGYSDFNINKYSGLKYHIDHVVPCAAFNLWCSFHQKLCFNWSNLQILRSTENLRKSNTLDFNYLSGYLKSHKTSSVISFVTVTERFDIFVPEIVE